MEFSGVFVFGLEISKARDLTQFCGISRVRVLFSLEFPGVKYKDEKLYYREVFKKVYPQPPCCVCIFSGIAECRMDYSRKNLNGGLRIWNFQGYQRNSMWNFQELIKDEVTKKK